MMRGIWDRETVALLMLAAVFPLALAWLLSSGLEGLVRLGFTLVVAGAWHLVFMLARAQPPSFAGALCALAIAVLAPLELGPIPFALGISFGVVMGELAFGGWGRNIVNPATIAIAFLGFGFASAPWPQLPVQLGWSVLPAILIGTLLGVMPWRVVAGTVIALAAGSMLAPLQQPQLIAAGVVLVLLVCDPVTAAATPLGRLAHGALYGGLVVIFTLNWSAGQPVQIATSAALLAALTAPLLDDIALRIWQARRPRLG
jgi:Na+-transporting NADH:ubiquinone oxidoreductase subunit B